jgi:predicted phosphodiesterase
LRYGIVADIHANREALEATLRHLEGARVNSIVCLGDLVGYHADPDACIALIRAAGALAITGNHDRAAIGADIAGDFGFVARRAIAWTAAHLDPENAAYLRELPSTLSFADDAAIAVHAGLAPEPNDRFHVLTPERVATNLARVPAGKTCFFGHTHRPATHVAADGVTRMINPGSVGQSRDGDWRAACAIYDGETVEFIRLEYDRDRALAKAAAAGLLEPPSAARVSYERVRAVARDAVELARRGLRELRAARPKPEARRRSV